MTLLPLDNNDKGHLKRLNENKAAIFALKKLFLNVCAGDNLKEINEMAEIAAQRIAIEYIKKGFHELSVINPAGQTGTEEVNLV